MCTVVWFLQLAAQVDNRIVLSGIAMGLPDEYPDASIAFKEKNTNIQP